MIKKLVIAVLMMISIHGTCIANDNGNDGWWVYSSKRDRGFDDVRNPFSVGLASFEYVENDEESTKVAAYGHLAFLGYKDIVKFNLGLLIPFHKTGAYVDMYMDSSISTVIGENIELGIFRSPLWDSSKAAWGIMLGYAW